MVGFVKGFSNYWCHWSNKKTLGEYSCSWKIQSNYNPCHQNFHSLSNKSSRKNQSNIQNVVPLMVILVACLKTIFTWLYTFRLYLKDKPIGNWWEEKTNIDGNPMHFSFSTSTLTSKLYASWGSNDSPLTEKQTSLVRKVLMMKKMVWMASPSPKVVSSTYFQ